MSYTILLVDDDAFFRKAFRKRFEEYEILEAASGEEALRILQKPNDIDLVLLDVVMPGISGFDTLKEIRKIAPGSYVVILTSYSTTDTAVEALRAHADDFAEKPLDPICLKEILEKCESAKVKDAEGRHGKVARVAHFVEKNYDKSLSLNDAAELVHLSPKYLSRIFKEDTGAHFHDYLIMVRLEKAEELLRTTGYNINQIADKLGYKNAVSFIRIFEKMKGETPTAYRRHSNFPKKFPLHPLIN